jgi:hypothetical protein
MQTHPYITRVITQAGTVVPSQRKDRSCPAFPMGPPSIPHPHPFPRGSRKSGKRKETCPRHIVVTRFFCFLAEGFLISLTHHTVPWWNRPARNSEIRDKAQHEVTESLHDPAQPYTVDHIQSNVISCLFCLSQHQETIARTGCQSLVRPSDKWGWEIDRVGQPCVL